MSRFFTGLLCCCCCLAGAAVATAESSTKAFMDPTRPPGQVAIVGKRSEKSRLQSILYSNTGSRSLAIIDGKSYAVGDRSPLGVIVRIDRDGVVLGGSQQRTVRLHRDLNKQMVAGN